MLNPLLLWFLPLAIVPLLLHLITLQRLRTVELSTFRFLMDSYVQQRRRMKLLEYLVVLLRIGFIAACVLMLTRPVMERYAGLFGGAAGGEVAIVVDAGPSMKLRTNLTTSLQRAKDAARTVVGMVDDDTRITIIAAGRAPARIVTRYASQRQVILDALDALSPDTAPANLAGALDLVFEDDPSKPRTVFLISDGNRAAWSGLDNHPILQRATDSSRFAIINVGPQSAPSNLTAAGDPPQMLRAIRGLPVQLTATVLNGSASEPADTVLSVFLDNNQVRRLPLALRPGERVSRTISVTPGRAGVVQGRFELPGDDYSDDDTFMFCLNVEPHLNLLLLTEPQPSSAGQNDQRYVRAALQAPSHAAQRMARDAANVAATLNLTAVSKDKLNGATLEQADVVIAMDVGLDPEKSALLVQYVESGGGLLVFPGPAVDPSVYNQHLMAPKQAGVEPAVLLEPPVGDPDDESAFLPVGTVDLRHPIFSAFDEPDADYFSTVRIYRHMPLRLRDTNPAADPLNPSAAQSAEALMRLPDGTPLLVELHRGAGTVLLAGVPASPAWSNLPLTGEFVATMLRTVAHLRRAAPVTAPATVRPHEPAPIQLTKRWSNASVQAVDPTNRSHAVTMARSGDHLVGALDHTHEKGYYTFSVLPRTDGAPQRVELGFAVNLDLRQSGLEMFDEAALRAVLDRPDADPDRGTMYLSSAPEDPVLIEQLRHKREIWRDLILAAFVVILIEFLLSTLAPARDDRGTRRRSSVRKRRSDGATERRRGEEEGTKARRHLGTK